MMDPQGNSFPIHCLLALGIMPSLHDNNLTWVKFTYLLKTQTLFPIFLHQMGVISPDQES